MTGVLGRGGAGQRTRAGSGLREIERGRRGAEDAAVARRGEPAVTRGEAVLVFVGRRDKRAELTRAVTGGEAHGRLGDVGVEGVVVGNAQLGAGVILFQNDVHHARDGFGAVDRAGALRQNLDAFDGADRDAVHAEIFASARAAGRFLAGVRDAATVDEDEGRIAAEATQAERRADGLGARGAAIGQIVVEPDRGPELRNGPADVGETRDAATLQFDLRDRKHRHGGRLGAEGADARARDLDARQLQRGVAGLGGGGRLDRFGFDGNFSLGCRGRLGPQAERHSQQGSKQRSDRC